MRTFAAEGSIVDSRARLLVLGLCGLLVLLRLGPLLQPCWQHYCRALARTTRLQLLVRAPHAACRRVAAMLAAMFAVLHGVFCA